jgi:hypothetical protein
MIAKDYHPPSPSKETVVTGHARIPNRAEIDAIISASANPSLRNLKITLCYGELSRALAARLPGNLNWCTFATWASKTAGRFIRMSHLDEQVQAALLQCFGPTGWAKPLPAGFQNLPGSSKIGDEIVIEAARNIAKEVSAEVAAGNLAVFTELAPLFSSLATMTPADAAEPEVVERTVKSLQPGPTHLGGQDLLRHAVADYYSAMFEADARRQAELILRANARVGAHEQIRLQPYIMKAMSAPLGEAVAVLLHRRARIVPGELVRARLDALLEDMLGPYRTALDQVWLQVSTRYMMTLELPNGTLHLGRDLPNAPGQPMFPPHLIDLKDPELLRILRIYRADGISARGSGASEWSNLSDRLRYILELFRSRQQDAGLLEPPFGPATIREIESGAVPLLGV